MLKLDARKFAKIGGFVLLAVVVLLFLLMIWTKRKIDNGDWVKWDGKWIPRAQFEKIVPPQVYKVESKNKPEEVYATFRQALLDNDVEKALGLIRVEKRGKYAEIFKDMVVLEKYKTLPVVNVLKESEKFDNHVSYIYYSNGADIKKDVPYTITFIKNKDGYWEIDAI